MGERNARQGEPGRPGLLLVRRDGVTVRCGGTTYLRLLSVKLEGRKQVSAAEFVNGAHLLSGEHFGES
jgi:methionyl-tRNA formyltransferase